MLEEPQKNMMIFVVGHPRSGTTMLGRILGNHPSIYTAPELQFFEKLWSSQDRNRILSPEETLKLVAQLCSIFHKGFFSRGDYTAFQNEAFELVKNMADNLQTPENVYAAFLNCLAQTHGKQIPCEQTPIYVFYLREILEAFPKARVINLIRDPRDVLVSQKYRWKQKVRNRKPLRFTLRRFLTYHPLSVARLWNVAAGVAAECAGHPRVYFMKFEDILDNPECHVRDLCEFLGLSYSPDILDIQTTNSSLIRDNQEQRGIVKTRTGNWQKNTLNSAELFICQMMTGRMMKRFGYQPVRVFPNLFFLAGFLFLYPLQLLLTFWFYRKHLKNVWETVKRRLLWPKASYRVDTQ